MNESTASTVATSGQPAPACRLGRGLVVFLLLLQIWSRYLPSPMAVLVGDDWANLARSSFYASCQDAALTGLQDPHRPLSMLAVEVAFRLFGTHPRAWTAISLLSNSLLLLLLAKMALELTGRRWVAGAAGILFAFLPNLTQTYHWSTQVLNEVTCALVFYALSAWLWIAHVRRGGAWRLAVSVLAYGVALFSYEAGILLPAAYVILLAWRREPVRSLLRMLPFGMVFLAYAAWRATNAFGLNQTWHYPPHMQAGVTLWGLAWNARQVAQWWLGDHLLGAMLKGMQSFATLAPWTRRLLFAGDAAVVLLAGWVLRRLAGAGKSGPETRPFSGGQVLGFGLVWLAAVWAINVVSYAAGRLNVLPAIGVCILVAGLTERWSGRKWGALLFVPALLALVANQGTAENFRQAGALSQGLYHRIQQTAGQWQNKSILLVDTHALRQRLTPGLLRQPGLDQDTWARYGNANLFRGFVPNAMVQLATGRKQPGIRVLLDVEYGAELERDALRWHDRYNPDQPHTNSLNEVYVIDGWAVGRSAP